AARHRLVGPGPAALLARLPGRHHAADRAARPRPARAPQPLPARVRDPRPALRGPLEADADGGARGLGQPLPEQDHPHHRAVGAQRVRGAGVLRRRPARGGSGDHRRRLPGARGRRPHPCSRCSSVPGGPGQPRGLRCGGSGLRRRHRQAGRGESGSRHPL
ncbi:MAG: Transcriptional regulator, MarR family, partial [uncultured Nocardioidaceae bacterium]